MNIMITNTIKGTSKVKPYKEFGVPKYHLELIPVKYFKQYRKTLLKLGRSTPDFLYGILYPFGLKFLS